MSTIDMHPPQTYSRLFRPWDTKSESESCKSSTSEISNSSDEVENQSCDMNVKRESFEDMWKLAQMNALRYPLDSGIGHIPSPPLGLPSPADFYYGSAGLAPMPTAYGIDPLNASLMEQEYARVMAEDAQIKAMNARKQRPKKFKCPHCDVAFSNNGQLKGHIRIHTGERPFKCDVDTCGKTFTRNEELTRHKRIHTGLRPFGCTSCGKKFGRRDHLKKHMKTHMPQDRPLGPAIFVPMYPYLYGY